MGRRDRNNSADFVMMSPPPIITDGGGHAFLMVDPSSHSSSVSSTNNHNNTTITTTTTPRWGRRRGLLRKAHSSPDCPKDLGHLEEPLRRLSFTGKELQQVIDDPEQFRMLQCQLREQGAITNSMVKEGIHFYVQTCLEDKQQRLLSLSSSSSSESNSASPSPKLITPPSVTSTASSASGGRRFGFRTPPCS